MVSMTRLIWSKMAKDGMKAIIRYYRKEASAQVARNHNLYPAGSTTIASYAPNRGCRTVVGNKKQGISLYNQFTL
jgi:plasmid stabilization system protein ParE